MGVKAGTKWKFYIDTCIFVCFHVTKHTFSLKTEPWSCPKISCTACSLSLQMMEAKLRTGEEQKMEMIRKIEERRFEIRARIEWSYGGDERGKWGREGGGGEGRGREERGEVGGQTAHSGHV